MGPGLDGLRGPARRATTAIPGPRNGRPPDLPLVYLPARAGQLERRPGGRDRATAGGRSRASSIHFSFGAGTHFLLLRDQVDGQPQGAVVPLPGEFLSGVHRGRFNPGGRPALRLAGWPAGGRTPRDDGCFQRVRYTGDPVQLPVAFHAHENGVLVTFTRPARPARSPSSRTSHFAQAWNYRYSRGYGSPELSPRHPGMPGHDPLAIRSAHVLADGRTLFLEIPDIQPVNQLHLHLRVDAGAAASTSSPRSTSWPRRSPGSPATARRPRRSPPTRSSPTWRRMNVPKVPNPWREPIPGAREVHDRGGQEPDATPRRRSRSRPASRSSSTFSNPDVVPHNWALIRPGTLARVGDLVNKIIAEPDAAVRHYIPRTDDVLVYADIVDPGREFVIYFRAPTEKGRYPYLCTFPGHWMVMNGVMTVE